MKRGFTLIELLIVVAIIAILAAIAVPNFLEAQTRSKVARTKADMRTIGTALEAYAVDYNGKLPPCIGNRDSGGAGAQITRGAIWAAYGLSTPIAYLSTSAMLDPFCKTRYFDKFMDTTLVGGTGAGTLNACLVYLNVPLTITNWKNDRPAWWVISYGPDYINGPDVLGKVANWSVTTYATGIDPLGGHSWDVAQYDPTNGTMSGGDIMKHQ